MEINRNWKVAFCAALGFILAGGQSAYGASPDPATTVVEQRLTYHSNGALGTPVNINRKPPLEFIIDTGATLSGIWNSAIQQNSLSHKHLTNANIEAADGWIKLRILQFQSLHVSALSLDPPILMEFPDYYAYYRRPLSGILGADFLKNYVVVFDFPRQKLVLYPKRTDLMKKMPGYFDAVPLTYADGYSALLMSVRVNGRRTKALLDTGAAKTTILESEARRLGIDYKNAPQTSMTGIGGNRLKAYIVEIDEIAAGSRTWDEPQIVVSQFTVEKSDGFSMLFGIDLLGQTPFAIDYGRNRLLLAKPEAIAIAEAERLSGQNLERLAQGLVPLEGAVGPAAEKGFACAFPAAALEGLTCISQ